MTARPCQPLRYDVPVERRMANATLAPALSCQRRRSGEDAEHVS